MTIQGTYRQQLRHPTTKFISQTGMITFLSNVLECSIAEICSARKLFPDDFFAARDTGKTIVTIFNPDVLKVSRDNMKDICPDTPNQILKRSSSSGASFQSDDTSSSIRQEYETESRTSPHHETDSCANESIISQLTSSFPYSQIPEKLSYSPNNPVVRDTSDEGTSTCTLLDIEHQLLRAEAVLLLNWIREGITQVVDEDERYGKLTFGVCVSRGVDCDDILMESYTFNITKSQSSDQTHPKGKNQICNIQNSFDSLYCNLSSYTRTLTSSSSTLHDHTQKILHKSRYFLVSIDFFQQVPSLPYALHLSRCSVIRLVNLNNPSDRGSPNASTGITTISSSLLQGSRSLDDSSIIALGKVQDENGSGLGVGVSAFYYSEYHESACELIDHQHSPRSVQTSKDYKALETLRTQNNIGENTQLHGEITNQEDKPIIIDKGIANKKRKPRYGRKSSFFGNKKAKHEHNVIKDKNDLLPFKREEKILAIPHLPPMENSYRDDYSDDHEDDRNHIQTYLRQVYLPCTILDVRQHMKKNKHDYKVLFEHDFLIGARMKKQWVSSLKIKSEDEIRSLILKEYTKIKSDDVDLEDQDDEIVNDISRKIMVDSNFIRKEILEWTKKQQFKSRRPRILDNDGHNVIGEEIKWNETPHLSSSKCYGNNDCGSRSFGKRRYCYVMNPVSTVLTL